MPDETTSAADPTPLQVSSCADKVISDFIGGVYVPCSSNHGKVVYKKEKRPVGHDVLIYYWDERDGEEECGWWFGPNVGGNQVWAYHPCRSGTTPPASGWNVPHDGDVDPSFTVVARPRSNDEGPARKQARVAPGGGASHANVLLLEVVDDAKKRRDLEMQRQEEESRKLEDRRRREEKRRLKAEKKVKKEEEKRKLEEQKLMEEQRKAEEQRRREVEKRRLEDEKRRKEMEERRRLKEEAAKRRVEDAQQYRQEAEKQRKEREEAERQHHAAEAVQKVLHRLSNASMESYWKIRQELVEVMATELPHAGPKRELLEAEARRVVEYAQEHIEQIRQQEIREQEKMQEALEELAALAIAAEEASNALDRVAEPLKLQEGLEEVELLEMSRAVEAVGFEALMACLASVEFLSTHGRGLQESLQRRGKVTAVVDMDKRNKAALQRVKDALRNAAGPLPRLLPAGLVQTKAAVSVMAPGLVTRESKKSE